MKLKHIITHPGQAHRDDFLSCCLIMTQDDTIYRRNPIKEEILDSQVMVIDIGGSDDMSLMNFDHHQYEKDSEPICSLTLILKFMELEQICRDVCPWFLQTEWIDSKGPFFTSNQLGISPDTLLSLQSPIENQLLQLFSGKSEIAPKDPLHEIMFSIGASLREYLDKIKWRLQRLSWLTPEFIGSIPVLDVTSIPVSENPVLGLELYCKKHLEDVPVVTVTMDDRGDGFSIFRRNDSPLINFAKLEGHPEVIFAHKNGFVCKTTKGANWKELVQLAKEPNGSNNLLR